MRAPDSSAPMPSATEPGSRSTTTSASVCSAPSTRSACTSARVGTAVDSSTRVSSPVSSPMCEVAGTGAKRIEALLGSAATPPLRSSTSLPYWVIEAPPPTIAESIETEPPSARRAVAWYMPGASLASVS